MVKIIKGRYGYRAEDGTVQIAVAGKVLELDRKEEDRLIGLGAAEAVSMDRTETDAEGAGNDNPAQEDASPMPKPGKRKGRKT